LDWLPEQFFDINTLNTVGGSAVAVYMIVRFTKPIFKRVLPDWSIRFYTLIISWGVLFFARSVSRGLTVTDWGLTLLDGFIVTFAAMGLHETVADPRALKTFIYRRK